MRQLLLCMAGGHKHLPVHARPWVTCGSFLQAIEPARLQCCQTNLSALNKGIASSPFALLLSSFLGDVLGPRHALAAGREEEHWWALQMSCQSSHSSTCPRLTLKGWSSSLCTWLLLSAIFSRWVWDSGSAFSSFPKRRKTREVWVCKVCGIPGM